MPKLSIIIPVYNVQDYLEKCLNSVIYPELPDYEIVIVNDGSTDSSPLIAREYAARYPGLITLIETENRGNGAARNTGIEISRGEYVIFIDSDDYLANNAVGEILDTIDDSFDICLYNIVSVTSAGRVLGIVKGYGGSERVFNLDKHPLMILESHSPCNKIIRKSLFTENGILFPGKVWNEDLRTIPKLYPHAERITYCDRNWYYYLNRPGSITNNRASVRKNLEIIDALDDLADYYRQHERYDDLLPEFEYYYYIHELITTSVKVLLADAGSDIVPFLVKDFTERFPNFKKNKYFRSSSAKQKLICFLLQHKMYRAVVWLMNLNSLLKRKDKSKVD